MSENLERRFVGLLAHSIEYVNNVSALVGWNTIWIRKDGNKKAHMNVGSNAVLNTAEKPFGAGRGTRTPTLSPAADFESAASTNSAIPAI